jgi:hypothetical protein
MIWRLSLASAIGLLFNSFASTLSAVPADLTADQVITHAVAQAQANQRTRANRDYTYRKVSTTEVLDGHGEVKDRKEKIFVIQAGKASLQQMKFNGELASAEALKKEERWTSDARQEVTESKNSRDENWEKFLTEDLTARYVFKLAGIEPVNGRAAYVITFMPRSDDLPVRKMADRVLNRLAGKIWIDKEESEIARAHVSLQSPATLGGLLKVVGALKRFDYTVERLRIAENVWFNRTSRGNFESRKFWDSTHTRTSTEATGFQKHHSAQN